MKPPCKIIYKHSDLMNDCCNRFEWDRERGEATEEARRRQEQWRDLKVADLQLEQSLGRYPAPAPAEAGSKTSKHKLKQMKSSANKKMSSLKSQITDIYRYVKIGHTSS